MSTQRISFILSAVALLVVLFAAPAAQAQTFTPEITPATPPRVNVTAGDPNGITFQAAINHDPGFNASIRVYFGPMPSGITITPSEQFLNPPYNAINFTLRAAATATSGPQDILVIYSSSQTKTTQFLINVVGGSAPPPSFFMTVTPDRFDVPQGQTRAVTLSIASQNGFSGAVEVTSEHSPALLEVAPVSPFVVNVPANGTATQVLNVKAKDGAAVGSANFLLYGRSGTIQDSVPVYPTITPGAPPPDFTFAVSQPAGPVTAGQTSSVSATVTPLNNFSGPVAIAVSSPGNAITASPVTLTSPYVSTPIPLQISPAAVGAVPVTFTATSGTLQKTSVVTFNVQPAQTAAFDLQVTPLDVAVTAGQSTTMTVLVSGSGGFAGTVNVTAPVVNEPNTSVTFSPSSFTLTAGQTRAVNVSVSASSPATTAPLALELVGTSGTLRDTAPFRLTIAPPVSGNAPSVQAITPMAYAPLPAQEFIVLGRNFAPGAAVAIEQPDRGAIQILGTRYISPTQLGVTLTVGASTPARGYRVTVRNASGVTSVEPVVLVVAPQGSLGGPAAVTRAAIEYPIRGQVIASGKGSIAAAHLATSGSGTIIGRWRLRQANNDEDPGYVFDQFTATVAGGYLVSTDRPCFDANGRAKTTAHVCASIPMLHHGTYSLELLVDQPRMATRASVPVTIQSDSATELTVYRPRNDATIDAHDPEFSWTLVPGAAQYQIELVRVSEDAASGRPILISTSEATWRPDVRDLGKRYGITAGTYRWRVVAVYPGDLRGQVSDWLTLRFTDVAFTSARRVATVASLDVQVPETPAAPAPAPSSTYAFAPNATLTDGREQKAAGQFTVSTQGELGGTAGTSKITSDLNYSASNDPRRVVQQSRNWVVAAGTPDDRAYGAGAQFGYTTPDFTSGAEFLTSGSAQTGVIGRARSRFGTFSYYQPVSTTIHGVMSAVPQNLDIRSAAFSTADGKPYQVRLIALEVEEPEDETLGVIASRLRTFGVYSSYNVSPAFSILGELAHGNVRSQETGDGRKGIAARLGISGMIGTFNYAANIRSIGANFVNPANRGLTPGGVSDRVMLDVNLGKSIGRTSLQFGLRRQDQGRSGESTMPRADETGFTLGVTTMFAGVSMNVSANHTANRGEADEITFFPATHRDSSGVTTTLSRTFGRVSLAQTLGVQRMSDEINPLTDQTMFTAGLNASGTFFTNLTLNASLNGSRMDAVEELGTTSSWTASLQPILALPVLSLSLQPSLSLSRSDNATLASRSKSEQYNLSLQWSPTWLGNIVGAQVTSSWSRSGANGVTGKLVQSYQGSLTLRMNKQRGMPWFPIAPQPGTLPPAAP